MVRWIILVVFAYSYEYFYWFVSIWYSWIRRSAADYRGSATGTFYFNNSIGDENECGSFRVLLFFI